MSRLFYQTMQDNAGNLLFDVSGTMRLAGSGTLATIYGDEALTVILPNPMTNHPSFGSFKCFLGAGDYDFYMAKSGYTFETLTGVQGHGTMAQQDASAVAITGGSAALSTLTVIGGGTGLGRATDASYALAAASALVDGTVQMLGTVKLSPNTSPNVATRLFVNHDKNTEQGLVIRQAASDTASGNAILFQNTGAFSVGAIVANATSTAYNTTSDSRLKKMVETLTGELPLIQALRPVSFRWLADGSPGVGFLAHEVAALVQGVISGEEGAVDGEGGIMPQMIDMSKLVPFLVGAIKTLTARIAVLEDALGV